MYTSAHWLTFQNIIINLKPEYFDTDKSVKHGTKINPTLS